MKFSPIQIDLIDNHMIDDYVLVYKISVQNLGSKVQDVHLLKTIVQIIKF
jgi:hypothetical protein